MDFQYTSAITDGKTLNHVETSKAEEKSNSLYTASLLTQNIESVNDKDFENKGNDYVYSNEIHFIHLSQLNSTNQSQNIENVDPLLISQLTISSPDLKLNQSNSSTSLSISSNCGTSGNNIYNLHNTTNPDNLVFESVAMSQITCDSIKDENIHKIDPLEISNEIISQLPESKNLCRAPTSPEEMNAPYNDICVVRGLNIEHDSNEVKTKLETKKEAFKKLDNASNNLNYQDIFERSTKENFIECCVKHSQTLGDTLENKSHEDNSEEHSNIIKDLALNKDNKTYSKISFNENCIAEFKKFISSYPDDNLEETEDVDTISNEYNFDDGLFEPENIHHAETSEKHWWVRKSVDQTIDPEFEEFVNMDPHYRITSNPTQLQKPKNLIQLFKFSPMYLLIGDIECMNVSKYNYENSTDKWFELFNHLFYLVMLYGRVVETKKCSRNILYTVDDGTGSVKVRFNHNSKNIKSNLKQVNELEHDLAKAKLQGLPNMLQDSHKGVLAEKYIAKMEKLVLLIRQRMNRCSREMQVGNRVHVIGHPYFNEKSKTWTINALNLEIDETNGPSELFWKKFIVFIYKEIYYKQDPN